MPASATNELDSAVANIISSHLGLPNMNHQIPIYSRVGLESFWNKTGIRLEFMFPVML